MNKGAAKVVVIAFIKALSKTFSLLPGFYNPQLLSKHSFFYNDSRVWVPV